jgi:hypothetical protein
MRTKKEKHIDVKRKGSQHVKTNTQTARSDARIWLHNADSFTTRACEGKRSAQQMLTLASRVFLQTEGGGGVTYGWMDHDPAQG